MQLEQSERWSDFWKKTYKWRQVVYDGVPIDIAWLYPREGLACLNNVFNKVVIIKRDQNRLPSVKRANQF